MCQHTPKYTNTMILFISFVLKCLCSRAEREINVIVTSNIYGGQLYTEATYSTIRQSCPKMRTVSVNHNRIQEKETAYLNED